MIRHYLNLILIDSLIVNIWRNIKMKLIVYKLLCVMFFNANVHNIYMNVCLVTVFACVNNNEQTCMTILYSWLTINLVNTAGIFSY